MREIYLDNCASTRVDEEVAGLAAHVMLKDYGNPSSLHKKGLEAELLLTESRRRLAAALGCEPGEVVFTSGGTESDNLAILGAAEANRRQGNAVVTTAWEHSAVLEATQALEKRGFTLLTVNPGADGRLDIEKLANLTGKDTVLVSCMMVNSEVGTILDIERLTRLIKAKNNKTLVHCDAVQGFGKLPFSVKKLGVDLLSVSGHKIHGPKGTGALYVKKAVRVSPLFFGGGQEKKLRPGTEALPLIAAFGLAAENAAKNLNANLAHARALCKHFVNKSAEIPSLCMNSPPDATPYICNASLLGHRSETLLHYLAAKGIYVSSGSACGKGRPSHVLTAMNLSHARVAGALRLSFSKYNTTNEIDAFFEALKLGLKEIKN